MTGASGHVGAACARYLADRGHEVVALSRRPRAFPGVAEQLEVEIGSANAADRIRDACARCDGVLHAAAAVDRDPHSSAVSLTNCLGTQQMVELAESWKVERLVYVSGVSVIGRPRELPVTESHSAAPLTAYHASKLYGEHLMQIAAGRGLPTATVRLTAPVGPGTPPHRILAVFARCALAGEPLRVLGRGSRRQDYVDVRDAAAAVELCLTEGGSGCFNVGRGASISNLELARLCVQALGSSSPVETADRPDPEEGIAWEVSIARAEAELGYQPRHTIEESIRSVASEMESSAG